MAGTLDSDHDAPTEATQPTRRALLGASAGEACVSCEAPLAADQRYCLHCGERRGKSRFTAATLSPTPDARPQQTVVRTRRRRLSPNATLVTGVATLLLAMGVGVEIGRLGNNSTPVQRASAPGLQVVTVDGGPGAAAAGGARRAKKTKSKHATITKVVHLSKQVAAKADAAASKVLGSSSKNLAPTTVQPGQSCSHGAGCHNGKFDGNFFGG